MTRRQLLRQSAIVASTVAAPSVIRAGAPVRKVKVGMIGTSHSHAAGKLETVRKLTDLYDIVGVVEPGEKRRQSLATRKEYAGLAWMTEEQLLNHPGLDVVLVETDVADLVPTAKRVAAAGMHMHMEKPAGPSLPAFRDLLGTLKSKSRLIQMGYMFRGNPAFGFVFKAAREGLLGDIFEIHGVIGKVIGAGERKATAQFAGGMMFELACHLIDATVAILGKPQAVQAHLRRTQAPKDDLADNTLAVLEYPKALATIRSAAIDVEGGARRQFIVCGDKGAAAILPLESPKLTLTLAAARDPYKKGAQAVTLPPMPGRYDEQLAEFARIIRGEKPLDYTPEHDLAVHETVLRASGMPVD